MPSPWGDKGEKKAAAGIFSGGVRFIGSDWNPERSAHDRVPRVLKKLSKA
jgi:hypothetical protein